MDVNKVGVVEIAAAPSSDHEQEPESGERGGALPMDSSSGRELAALRRRIDEADRHLARVLRERGSLAARAARLKARAGVPVSAHRDWGREHEIVKRAVASICTGVEEEPVLNAYDEKAVRAIYNELFEASFRFVKNEMRLRFT